MPADCLRFCCCCSVGASTEKSLTDLHGYFQSLGRQILTVKEILVRERTRIKNLEGSVRALRAEVFDAHSEVKKSLTVADNLANTVTGAAVSATRQIAEFDQKADQITCDAINNIADLADSAADDIARCTNALASAIVDQEFGPPSAPPRSPLNPFAVPYSHSGPTIPHYFQGSSLAGLMTNSHVHDENPMRADAFSVSF